MTPSIAKQVLKLFSQPFQQSSDIQTLTPREHDVLSLLVRGFSYKMAASEMQISIETFRFHIKTPNETWSGTPAFKYTDNMRANVLFKQLPEMEQRIRELEKIIAKLI